MVKLGFNLNRLLSVTDSDLLWRMISWVRAVLTHLMFSVDIFLTQLEVVAGITPLMLHFMFKILYQVTCAVGR